MFVEGLGSPLQQKSLDSFGVVEFLANFRALLLLALPFYERMVRRGWQFKSRCYLRRRLKRFPLQPSAKCSGTFSVRSIQRWEADGLPVKRVTSSPRSSIVADSDELDTWILHCNIPRAAVPSFAENRRRARELHRAHTTLSGSEKGLAAVVKFVSWRLMARCAPGQALLYSFCRICRKTRLTRVGMLLDSWR